MTDRFRATLLKLPRRQKRLLQVAVDICLVWLALWLAFVVRLGIDDQRIDPFGKHLILFLIAPLIAIPCYVRTGMYRAVLRFMGNEALLAIFKAVTFSSLLMALALYWFKDSLEAIVPRSLIFNYWWLSLLLAGGLRLVMRQYFVGGWYVAAQQLPFIKTVQASNLPKVAIYGAGAAGNQLVAALRLGKTMEPVAFIDDDDNIATRIIAGLQVYKPKHLEKMIEGTGAQEILLAVPSATRARRREILDSLESQPLHVRTIPGFMDLASGRVKVDDLQEVDIADLLGRDIVEPNKDLIDRCILNRVVMVTGAGGSIGSELSRQIITARPQVLILFEHSEYNLYRIHRELEQDIYARQLPIELVPVLGSVRDLTRLNSVLSIWSVDTIYHAAAYKHVPMVEHNVAEGVMNNLLGTLYVAQAAIRAQVSNFVLISTDKAVRPTNIMGCTKRLAEMVLQALSKEQAPVFYRDSGLRYVNKTRFTMVRFGNVLGSSGSVIPLFRQQIQRGGPVTVTHPNITRYFMTIPEAAQLVIQAGSMGDGGDVFVLDMGEPVKIVDLAEKMIRLSGYSVRSEENPKGDVDIVFTGLRPGEKLYEELLIGDDVQPTDHPMIMCAHEECIPWAEFKKRIEILEQLIAEDDVKGIQKILLDTVSGYRPEGEIVDHFYLQRKCCEGMDRL